MMRKCQLVILLLTIIMIKGTAHAQWEKDGINLYKQYYNVYGKKIVPDNDGGMYYGCYEYANGWYYPKLRRYTRGSALDLDLGYSRSNFGSIDLASDGQGGVFFANMEQYNHPYLYHYDATGQKDSSVPIGISSYPEYSLKTVAAFQDGSPMGLVAFKDEEHGFLYLWKGEEGNIPWSGNGVALAPYADLIANQKLVADGSGGAIVLWETTGEILHAQRVDTDGNLMWGTDGVILCTGVSEVEDFDLVADGAQGAYFVWTDKRVPDRHVYAQHVVGSGTQMWTDNGQIVCGAANFEFEAKIVASGSDGAIFAWRDYRHSSWEIYAQRIDSIGNVQWVTDGLPICTYPSSKYGIVLTDDRNGGAIVGWHDYRVGNPDIYCARFDAAGQNLWDPDGVPVCTNTGNQYSQDIASDSEGGAIFLFSDDRDNNDDYYAQRIDRYGYWGNAGAYPQVVSDVPDDQGGEVAVAWNPSRLDNWTEEGLDRYTVWRLLDLKAAPSSKSAVTRIEQTAVCETGDLWLDAGGDKTLYWEMVGTQDAYGLPAYAMTVPTWRDSTASGTGDLSFRILSHSVDGTKTWISGTIIGHSVDNLAPAAPAAFTGAANWSPQGIQLDWSPNSESDLAEYRLYRDADPQFIPDASNLVAALGDTLFFDASGTIDETYKIVACDIHGNVGPWSALTLEGASNVPTPVGTGLTRVSPNPFNPSTLIEFETSGTGTTTLRVFDPAGRMVNTLVNESLAAGHHQVYWDGCDRSGRSLSSGMYFLRLEDGGRSDHCSVLMLK